MVSVVGGWGLHSHFCVQLNYSVEVVLRCVVVRVVTIDSRKLVVSTYKMQLDCCGGNLPPGSGKREKTRDIMGSN